VQIQENMFAQAEKFRGENTRRAETYGEFKEIIEEKRGFVQGALGRHRGDRAEDKGGDEGRLYASCLSRQRRVKTSVRQAGECGHLRPGLLIHRGGRPLLDVRGCARRSSSSPPSLGLRPCFRGLEGKPLLTVALACFSIPPYSADSHRERWRDWPYETAATGGELASESSYSPRGAKSSRT
jgi:hypothetical protein